MSKVNMFLEKRRFYNRIIDDLKITLFDSCDNMILYAKIINRKKRELDRIMKA